MKSVSIALAALLCATAGPALAKTSDLPRKAFLGMQLQSAPDGSGVAVGNVLPGGTGVAVGVQPGDILTAIDGKPVRSPGDVVAAAQALRSGSPVTLSLSRAGQPVTLKGNAQPRPMETYAGATVDYGAVDFRGNRLRDILVMPQGKPDAPVVFYIQGYTCAPVEGGPPSGFEHLFGDALIAKGLGYYRVEKIGIGDSVGPTRCVDVDYATELEGFQAAYRHLIDTRKVAPERIFMLGHSMGGIQAPMLAAQIAPRGVAVYGTGVRNWGDYHQDLVSTQGFLIGGQDPVEVAKMGEDSRALVNQFYFDKKSPAQIAADNPAKVELLKEVLNWDGGNNMFGRSYKFAQDLASLPLIQSWKDSKTNVLAMYGASDMVALTDIDHKYIADMANYWRPGSGEFVEIADTDHPMDLVGSRSAIREANRAGKPLSGQFNPKIVDVLADWIERSMAKPPFAAGG